MTSALQRGIELHEALELLTELEQELEQYADAEYTTESASPKANREMLWLMNVVKIKEELLGKPSKDLCHDHKRAQRESVVNPDNCLREYYAFQKKYESPPPYQIVWTRAWELGIRSIFPTKALLELPLGWEGYYTLGSGQVWFWCRIIAYDDGEPVVRTRKGNYHRRPRDKYRFQKVPPKGVQTR